MDGLFSNPNHLRLLQELLNPDNEDDSESDVITRTQAAKRATQNLPVQTLSGEAAASGSSTATSTTTVAHPQTIEDWERQEELLNDAVLDTRPRPEYTIVYKQAVRTEDIYLQMGNKTPATASCEEMTIKIAMPNETAEDIDRMQLDVAANAIDLQSPTYRLKLPLVQAIDPDKGKATWNAEKKVLTLVLVMAREFDFVNF